MKLTIKTDDTERILALIFQMSLKIVTLYRHLLLTGNVCLFERVKWLITAFVLLKT